MRHNSTPVLPYWVKTDFTLNSPDHSLKGHPSETEQYKETNIVNGSDGIGISLEVSLLFGKSRRCWRYNKVPKYRV